MSDSILRNLNSRFQKRLWRIASWSINSIFHCISVKLNWYSQCWCCPVANNQMVYPGRPQQCWIIRLLSVFSKRVAWLYRKILILWLHLYKVFLVFRDLILLHVGRHLETPYMMTSSYGNIFRVTGPLWGNPPVAGEFSFPRSAPEHKVEQMIATPVIWDAIALIVTSL